MLRAVFRCCLCILVCLCLFPAAYAASADAAAVLVVDASLGPAELETMIAALTGPEGPLDDFAAGGGAKRTLALVVFDRDAQAIPLGVDGFWTDVGSGPDALAAAKATLADLTIGQGSNLEGALAIARNLLTDSSLGTPVADCASRYVLLFTAAVPNRFPAEPVLGNATAVAGTGGGDQADYPSCQNIPVLARALRDSGIHLLTVGYGDLDGAQVVTATAALSCPAEGWHRHDPVDGYGEGVQGRLTEESFSLHLNDVGMPATGHRVSACRDCFSHYFQGPHQVLTYAYPTARQWLSDDLQVTALYAPEEFSRLADHFPPAATQPAQVVIRHMYHTFLTYVDEAGQMHTDQEETFFEDDAPWSGDAGAEVRVAPRPPREDGQPGYGPFLYGLGQEAVDLETAPEQTLTALPGQQRLTLHYSRRADLRQAATVRVVHSYAVVDANSNPEQNQSRVWQEGTDDAPLSGWYAGQVFYAAYRLPEDFLPDHIVDPDPCEKGVHLSPGLNLIVLSYERQIDTTEPSPIAPLPIAPDPGRRLDSAADPATDRDSPAPKPVLAAPPVTVSAPVSALLERLLQPESWREAWDSLSQLPLLRLLSVLFPPRA